MNKAEFSNALAEKLVKSKKETSEFVDGFIELMMDTVSAGDEVKFIGMGVFNSKYRASRECRNPKTGEMISVPESKSPHFKAGSEFKKRCNS